MGLKTYKPKTAALRFTTLSDFAGVSKKRPERKLVRIKKSKAGRNAHEFVENPETRGAQAQTAPLPLGPVLAGVECKVCVRPHCRACRGIG